MPVKIVSGLIAIVLLVAYVTPVVLKLKEIALGVVIFIGIVMMLVDLWQSLRQHES